MSYRNPQIIVDRSGEIWGQAIGKFGQDVSRGIEKYAAVKAKNQELARKKREANQIAANGVSQQFLENIEKTSTGIKDSKISQQFKDTATKMANTGEEMIINGKPVTIGAIEAQAELRMNPNLDKNTRNAYSKIVSKFKGYQSTMVSSAGNIISGLEGVSESTTGQIGKTYDFQGEGFKNTQSQIATYSLLNKQIPGVNSNKIISREKGEDGETKNMLTINSSIDTESDTYKNWEAAGLISKEDLVFEEGSTVGTFSWKRDLATWGEEGGLITEMSPQNQDSTESMKIAGFIDDKGNATGKGFNNNAVYTTRTVKGGTEKKSESHFDPDSLRDDPTYEAELRAGAAGILAMPLDQQEKFITNTLGWPTITREKWSKVSEEKKTEFLMEQRFENDLQKIMGAKGKKKVQTRDATQEDVDQYAADGIEISLLNPQVIDEATGLPAVDENGKELPRTPTKLYYTTTATSLTKDPKITTKGNQGKAFYDKVRKDPVGYYQERTGIKPKYETNAEGEEIITLPADAKNPEEKVYNMSNSAERKRFYNNLLFFSEMAAGNSADSKNIRMQFEDALSLDTAQYVSNFSKDARKTKTKATDENFFYNQYVGQSPTKEKEKANKKEKPGRYNNVNKGS